MVRAYIPWPEIWVNKLPFSPMRSGAWALRGLPPPLHTMWRRVGAATRPYRRIPAPGRRLAHPCSRMFPHSNVGSTAALDRSSHTATLEKSSDFSPGSERCSTQWRGGSGSFKSAGVSLQRVTEDAEAMVTGVTSKLLSGR